MHVTSEEIVHKEGNISFLSSWAKCLPVVNVCPWKHFACADDRKHVVQKTVLWEMGKIIYFVWEGISYGISFPTLEL